MQPVPVDASRVYDFPVGDGLEDSVDVEEVVEGPLDRVP
jgi:hypothetical protein